MADGILFSMLKLRHGFTKSRHIEERIVSETPVSCRFACNGAMNRTFGCMVISGPFIEYGNTAEEGFSATPGVLRKPGKKQAVVFFIGGIWTRISRRPHPRLSIQRRNHKTGIIGDNGSPVSIEHNFRLDKGILFKGFSTLIDLIGKSNVVKIPQIDIRQ
jgi:hypothetical protein